jgi:hypothetical protein
MFNSKRDSKVETWSWSSKADASKDNAWALMWRAFSLKLADETKPIEYVLDKKDVRNKLCPVPEIPEIPEDLEAQQVRFITVFNMRRDQAIVESKRALEHNKSQRAAFSKALTVLQSMFTGSSNAALCITAAIIDTNSPKTKFTKARKALESTFKPSGVTGAMALKEEMKTLIDRGRSHVDWEAAFQRLTNQLETIGQMPTLEEVDLIVLKNVENPHLVPLRTKLLLDHTDDSEGHQRNYTYIEFRLEAARLAKADEKINLWGLSSEKVLYAGKTQQTAPKPQRASYGGDIECWRCGGPHNRRQCVAKKCTKCHINLPMVNGKPAPHDATSCTGSGGTQAKQASKGGSKQWTGKKSGGAPVAGDSSTGGGKSRFPSTMPQPSDYSDRQLELMAASIDQTVTERKATASKRKALEEWQALGDN